MADETADRRLRFLIARRRSQQRLLLKAFIKQLHDIGVEVTESQIVDAEAAVRYELELAGRRQTWSDDHAIDDVRLRLDPFHAGSENTDFVIALSHSWDFPVRMPYRDFVGNAEPLAEFDRDTVYAFSASLDRGVCISRYDDEFGEGIRFAFAAWTSGA